MSCYRFAFESFAMSTRLPKFEMLTYFIIWITSIIYSMYNVYIDGNHLAKHPMAHEDFNHGWSFINHKKDVSDYEWVVWMNHLQKCIPWFFLQLLCAEFIRYLCVQMVPVSYVIITFAFLLCTYPPFTSVFFLAVFIAFFCILLVQSKVLIWAFALVLLMLMNISFADSSEHTPSDGHSYMMIHISACWFVIKCIDFSLFELHCNKKNQQKFVDMASFVFYFPCFHLGPFVPYANFKEAVYLPFEVWTYSRVTAFILNVLRFVGWMLMFELASHYFYCNALHYQISYILSKGPWSFNGVGYCMGQFFFIKYTAIYGLVGTLMKAERYITPPYPRCIHWVHRYSDMWRHFDRGFYLFIFSCIYKPLCGDSKPTWRRRLYASFLSFCFVFIWHGGNLTIFYWTVFNFIGITLEVTGKLIDELPLVKLWKATYLSESNIRRINALFSAPLWIFAVISNFIFFGGHDLGLLHLKQFVFGPWQLTVCIMIISYCMCQVSMEISLWMFPEGEKFKYNSLKKKI